MIYSTNLHKTVIKSDSMNLDRFFVSPINTSESDMLGKFYNFNILGSKNKE